MIKSRQAAIKYNKDQFEVIEYYDPLGRVVDRRVLSVKGQMIFDDHKESPNDRHYKPEVPSPYTNKHILKSWGYIP